MSEKIIRLFGNNDPRITELVNDIISLIYDRATGQMTVASIIGVLEMVKLEIIEDSE